MGEVNKRDSQSQFRVKEQTPTKFEMYWAFGWEIADKARMGGLIKNGIAYTVPLNASLKTCMKALVTSKGLDSISIQRRYIHQIGFGRLKDGSQGKARRFERLTDPICVYKGEK